MNKQTKSILLTGVAVKNGNFNMDFDMQPREFPSPFALKYALKSYWQENGETIFGLKSYKHLVTEKETKTVVKSFSDQFNSLVASEEKMSFEQGALALYNCLDTRLFGFVNVEKNYTHGEKGIVQVSYGTNLYEDTDVRYNEVIAPFSSDGKSGMTTIGSKIVVDFALYNYVTYVNPQATSTLYKLNQESLGLPVFSQEDYEKLVDGMKNAVTNLNTSSKTGCTTSYVVQLDLKENEVFPSVDLSALVKVEKDGNKTILDFAELTAFVQENQDIFENVTLHADKYSQEIKNWM